MTYRPAWDDLRAPATSIPLHGSLGDPDADTDGTLLFAATSAEQVSIIYQMPHNWYRTPVGFHVHWSKTTDAAGDVEWEYRYRAFNNNAIPTAFSDWIAADSRSQAIAADQTVLIDGFPLLDISALKVSCIISIQLRRNPDASDDNYAADARLWEADLHYQKWGEGTQVEYPQ